MQYVVIGDGFECVCACHAGFGWVSGAGANPLAEPSQFICIRLVPGIFVFGVAPQLAMAKGVACFLVEDWECECSVGQARHGEGIGGSRGGCV